MPKVEEFERAEHERMEERKLATKKILERMKQEDALRSFDGSTNGGGGGGGGASSDLVSDDDDLDSESDDDDTMDDEVGGVGGGGGGGGIGGGLGKVPGATGKGRKSAKRPSGPAGGSRYIAKSSYSCSIFGMIFFFSTAVCLAA